MCFYLLSILFIFEVLKPDAILGQDASSEKVEWDEINSQSKPTKKQWNQIKNTTKENLEV